MYKMYKRLCKKNPSMFCKSKNFLLYLLIPICLVDVLVKHRELPIFLFKDHYSIWMENSIHNTHFKYLLYKNKCF